MGYEGLSVKETDNSHVGPVGNDHRGITPLVLLFALLLCSTTICYIDRQVLSISAPLLRTRFSMSNLGYSEVVFAFLLAYAIFSPLVGRLIDRIGTQLGLALAVIFWSIASMLHAMAIGPLSLGLFRFLLGVGEAGNFPACVKIVAEQVPSELRALATGVFNVGAGLGAVVAPPLVVWLILRWGWQASFLATGSIGLVWVLAWLLLHRSPWRPLSPGTLRRGSIESTADTAGIPWTTLLGCRQVWVLMLTRFVSDPAWYFYLFWLPEYLHSVRGFSLEQIGSLAWIPFLSADAGSITGGWIGSLFMRKGWSLNKARKVAMGSFAACMPITVAAAYASRSSVVISLICLATFAHQAWSANIITLPADLFPPKAVGVVYGLTAFSSSIGGMIFMLVIGWVVDHYSYASIFLTVGLMHPLAAAVLFIMIPRLEMVNAATLMARDGLSVGSLT